MFKKLCNLLFLGLLLSSCGGEEGVNTQGILSPLTTNSGENSLGVNVGNPIDGLSLYLNGRKLRGGEAISLKSGAEHDVYLTCEAIEKETLSSDYDLLYEMKVIDLASMELIAASDSDEISLSQDAVDEKDLRISCRVEVVDRDDQLVQNISGGWGLRLDFLTFSTVSGGNVDATSDSSSQAL